MSIRDLYWRKLCNFKYQLEYIILCRKRCILLRRIIQIGSAITSSAAVAAWTNWTELSFLWGCIIVIAQVVAAVYEVLPYKKRTEELPTLISQLELLYIEIEESWQRISSNPSFSKDKIISLLYDYERKWANLCNNTLSDDMLPQSKKLATKATEIMNSYMTERLDVKPIFVNSQEQVNQHSFNVKRFFSSMFTPVEDEMEENYYGEEEGYIDEDAYEQEPVTEESTYYSSDYSDKFDFDSIDENDFITSTLPGGSFHGSVNASETYLSNMPIKSITLPEPDYIPSPPQTTIPTLSKIK